MTGFSSLKKNATFFHVHFQGKLFFSLNDFYDSVSSFLQFFNQILKINNNKNNNNNNNKLCANKSKISLGLNIII